ncbi:glycosyltransferase, partial [archaeon]|nr:glycosyltransferase [archaeon]
MNRTPVVILGIPIDSFPLEETIGYIFHLVDGYEQDERPRLVCTVNLDLISNTLSWSLKKSRHPELLSILRNSDLVTADGMPVLWASRFLGQALHERVTGADLVPLLCRECAQKGKSVFFLGGRGDSARDASMVLTERYPGLIIAGCESPFVHTEGIELSHAYGDDDAIVDRINASKADILLIAFGNPKQEIWFARNRHRLKVPVSIGVGGTFDFITGTIARAPEWMRRSFLEWLFRITRDPRTILKRYFIDFIKFGIMIWPSVLMYQYMKRTAPLAYLKRCKNRFSYKYLSCGSGGVLSVLLPGIIDSATVPRLTTLVPKRP